ncbi:FAD-dependent oxidoreductase [Ureibacillus aquaedulcis]|uniref:FAD-dependent oxidoreductase n=1 Tax=Ureibacillus aquaedulcis TaxID=3058421 RepID=A0ABT8GL89_9BACL|nr:FAD-dependent oxidoreductase [Ureibacillus sp. BA0131]MDN4492173.1 FAD-dependent oxidoreductase [Ureibacillus sp. BA0131]
MARRNILITGIFCLLLIASFFGTNIYNNTTSATTPPKSIPYEKPSALNKFDDQYDVIVIGGEPEGVAAAVSAARNGAKTLLVESREELGGLFTFGMMNFLDIPQGADGRSVSHGLFEEWHKLVGKGNTFYIETAKAAFQKLVNDEQLLSLTTNTNVVESIMIGNQVVGVKLQNENGNFEVKGKAFIDATQDADFAVMSKVPYFIGGTDIGMEDKKMAVTLMLHLKNVNWDKVKETALTKKFGEAEVTDQVAWGFSQLHYDYKPVEQNTRLRGLNLAKIGNEYTINALQIFGIDGLDESSKQAAIEKGKKETMNILQFLQKEFPGFEQVEVASYPPELYVRETRHIWSEYQLPMADVWTNRDHWDNIGYGAYPVDVQAQTPQDYGFVLADPKQYAIPFRSLVPMEIDGILVVGRAAGFSSLAAGSARIVPTGMVTGQAAGAAAALAVLENKSFREMSKDTKMIETLRTNLNEQGAFVEHISTDYPYMGEWFDGSIQQLLNYGLVSAGYSNDLKVENEATVHSFIKLLKETIERTAPKENVELRNKITTIFNSEMAKENRPLQLVDVTQTLSALINETGKTPSWQGLIDQGIIGGNVAENIPGENHSLKFKEMYAICAEMIRYVKE